MYFFIQVRRVKRQGQILILSNCYSPQVSPHPDPPLSLPSFSSFLLRMFALPLSVSQPPPIPFFILLPSSHTGLLDHNTLFSYSQAVQLSFSPSFALLLSLNKYFSSLKTDERSYRDRFWRYSRDLASDKCITALDCSLSSVCK